MNTQPSTGAGASGEATPLRIRVFDVEWDLDFHGLEPAVVATLRELWSRAAVPVTPLESGDDTVPSHAATPGDAQPLRVASASAVVAEPDLAQLATVVGDDAEAIPYSLSRSITLQSITRRRGQALMLHAVGLCGADGRTVALVAPSGTGKTTAASVLGRSLGYVTDETVVIEADDRVSPYPKPLSIITDPDVAHDKHERSPDALGLLPIPAGEVDPTIAAVVVIRRDPDLAEPRLELLRLVEAILDVIPETSALPSLPNPLDRLCRVLTKSGGPYRLTYAEIDQCVDLVRSLTVPDADRDADCVTWTHHPGTGWSGVPDDPAASAVDTSPDAESPEAEDPETENPETADRPVAWEDVIERCPWTDGVQSDGEVLLLHGLVPVRLSHLGSVLWLHSGQPAPIADLHDQVVAEIGHHDRSAGLVLEAVQTLVDAKVLRTVRAG